MKEINLTLEQEIAISACIDRTKREFAITGGAGTGKTTILKHVYEELKGVTKVLCAPTGRAAKRIQEATGIPAVTIHRLLKFPQPSDDDVEIVGVGDTYAPRHNSRNPLPFSVILVDEASMIGPILNEQLQDAMPKGGVIRYFGDANQLPPVEEGKAPFRSLVATSDAVVLTTNFRSDDEIIGNAELILRGRMPQRNSRFEIIYTEEPLRTLVKFVDEEFAKSENQIIMTMRKGQYGTVRANPSLQIKFNPNGVYLKLDRMNDKEPALTIKPSDKFLWIKNDYTFNLYNGEIGVIDDIDEEDGTVRLGLVDRESLSIPARAKARGQFGPYEYDPRKQIDLGYAITTHKSQGSEFDTVIYCMCSKGQGGAWMSSRNNFYTGVTRAKKNVIVITDRKAMQLSVRRVV